MILNYLCLFPLKSATLMGFSNLWLMPLFYVKALSSSKQIEAKLRVFEKF